MLLMLAWAGYFTQHISLYLLPSIAVIGRVRQVITAPTFNGIKSNAL